MFSHGFLMVRVRRINNGFIGLNGFLGASSRGCTCLRSALPLARARSAPTKKCTNQAHECRLLC